MTVSYRGTIHACYLGYITQAIVNSFPPLLFVCFSTTWGIQLETVGLLVTLNFLVQLLVDLISARLGDRLDTRKAVVAAHALSALGLVSFAVLPFILPSPMAGLCLSMTLCAVGGGLIEVLISPIVEACPGDEKAAAMSLLHSFYCWGCVLVVLLSSLLFAIFGVGVWRVTVCLWALLPLFNMLWFTRVPIAPLIEEGTGMTMGALFRSGLFRLLAVMMVCSGAAEQAMCQWASAFAEAGLHISKTVGDLAGPCLFSVLMGLSRVVFARVAGKVPLRRWLAGCCGLCCCAYLLASLSTVPALSLAGCALCGLSVGAMWPGTFSLAGEKCPLGGITMFALLALAGDMGCSGGPTLVGTVSGLLGGSLKTAMLSGILFPCLLAVCLLLLARVPD